MDPGFFPVDLWPEREKNQSVLLTVQASNSVSKRYLDVNYAAW